MGGAFGSSEAEHNILSDVDAAQAVFASRLPIVVTGLEITRRIEIRDENLARMRAAGALGAALGRDIDQWWQFWNETWNVPHDPITVLTLLRPELFTLSNPGRVVVGTTDEDLGRTRFVEDPAGSTRIVVDLDADAVVEAITAGIVRAGARTPSPRD